MLLGPGRGACRALCMGESGVASAPLPHLVPLHKAGLGSLAGSYSLGPSFLLWCSCPTGSDRLGDFALNRLASPLPCPSAHSQHGEGTEPLAASGRNRSDRGHGEGRVGLARGAWSPVPRAVPEVLLGTADKGLVGPGVGLVLPGACP